MIQRIAAIGDIHACYEELEELYNKLCWVSLDEIWHLGDVCDRGPHSGKTIEFCRKHNIKGVKGNHDESIINHWDRMLRGSTPTQNADKRKTLTEIVQADVDYLKDLPYLHIFHDINTVLVHGGLWPKMPLYAQPTSVCRLQMIHPHYPGKTMWWGNNASLMFEGAKSEEELVKDGWIRWYKAYDHEQHIVFGHSTFAQPMIWQNPGYGKTIGVDTGSSFGGCLTACIMDNSGKPWFISVKNKKLYYPSASRAFMEG